MAVAVIRMIAAEDERDGARRGADLLSQAAVPHDGGVFVSKASGKKVSVALPKSVLAAIGDLLETLAENGEALIFAPADEVSAEKASELLGVSRPIVYRLMDDGTLPFRQVGAHRRVLASDVVRFKKLTEHQRRTKAASGKGEQRLPVSERRTLDAGVDELVLGTTNASFRRLISADELAACLRCGDVGKWKVHLTTFFTEVRPELVLLFAQRYGVSLQALTAAYGSIRSATGECSPTLERFLERLGDTDESNAARP